MEPAASFTKASQSLSGAAWLRFGGWSVVVMACLVWLGVTLSRGYQFDTSIMTLLPESERSVGESLAQERLAAMADKRLVFLVTAVDDADSLSAATTLADGLRTSGVFTEVQGELTNAGPQQWQNFYQTQRYQLLTESARERLQASDASLVDESLGRLYSPLASVFGAQLLDDPLQLYFQWQLTLTPPTAFAIDNQGWLARKVEGQNYRLITATLSSSAYDVGYQRRVLAAVAEAKAALAAPATVMNAGLLFHAAHGAEQAQAEISTIGVGSLLGILLLLGACFRSIRALVLALLPILVGCTFALAVTLLLFERLHLITLAFGAGLVGVGIDYGLHYLCATGEVVADKRSVLRRVLPSLSLGLLSSVLAYAAQGMAPFPGLRQMAAFSALGLFGAWVTVVCWLPVLQRGDGVSINGALVARLRVWQSRWPNVDTAVTQWLLAALALGLLGVVYSIEGNDDLRLLQTSPASMLQQEAAVQSLIAGVSPGQYFVVAAASEQALLEREERLLPKLQAAIDRDLIAGVMATAQYVPSQQRQLENRDLLQTQVYGSHGLLQTLAQRAGLQSVATQAQARFEQNPGQILPLTDWLADPVSAPVSHLWLGEQNGRYYSLISLVGVRGANAIAALAELAQSEPQVSFVDRVGSITKVLASYRGQLVRWLLAAYGLVLVILALRYGRNAWRVVAAPALASLLALAVLQLGGAAITVFHILALLLVLGIGLDASIFLQDSRNSPYTWLAVSLSALTTLLAFGLLALSTTPVLHYFGVTVLLGIIGVWTLAPCFIQRSEASREEC